MKNLVLLDGFVILMGGIIWSHTGLLNIVLKFSLCAIGIYSLWVIHP